MGKTHKIKFIVNTLTWFDRTNGNTYFSNRNIFLNKNTITTKKKINDGTYELANLNQD